MSSRTLPRHPFSSVPEYWDWVPNASGLSKEPLPWYFSFHCMPNISNKPLASSDSFPKQGSLSVQVARSAVSERHVLRHHEHQRSLAVPLSGEELPPLGANRSPLKSRFIDARCMHAPRAASSTARHWARMSGGNTVARGFEDNSQHEIVNIKFRRGARARYTSSPSLSPYCAGARVRARSARFSASPPA